MGSTLGNSVYVSFLCPRSLVFGFFVSVFCSNFVETHRVAKRVPPRVPESMPRVNESIQAKHVPKPTYPPACHNPPQASFRTSAPSVRRSPCP